MTAPQRMRAWGAGVSAGYVVLGVAGAVLNVPGAGLLFGLCAAVTLALALIVAPLLRPRRRDDGNGGLGAPRPDEPPPWWPEFEREFRAYTERLTSVRR
jgi:drug/metabolite transporter (DMT)-like permease